MPDNNINQSDGPPIRITGAPTATTDHPALRKIARAVIAIAERRQAEQAAIPGPDAESDDD